MCTSTLDVYKYTGCVQVHWMCTSTLDVYKYTGCVQVHWMCTSTLDVYKYTGCVQRTKNSKHHSLFTCSPGGRSPSIRKPLNIVFTEMDSL